MTRGTTSARALEVLSTGEIEVLGALPYSSNYTFLARVREGDDEVLAVYKPRRGESPLWDFPPGTLAAREVAAFLVGEAAGWGFVPPTILRSGAPLGEGSVQLFIEHDPERHYFILRDEYPGVLRAFAAFDVVVNNADRKSGHVLEDASGKLWAVDHGLTFNVELKLRTVIWRFGGEPLGDEVRVCLQALRAALQDRKGLAGDLGALLSDEEVAATRQRVEALLLEDRFPTPAGDRPLPWPLI